MAFLSGSLGFERFRVVGEQPKDFGEEHLEILQKFSAGPGEPSSTESTQIGFLGGTHLFDQSFDLEKNVIHGALHFGLRIDTNQVPAAIRKAWLQMELANLLAEHPERRPTKSQRQEAKDAVEQRCEAEVASGKYHRMNQFPILWDAESSMVYFGGTNGSAWGHCADLLNRAFDIEFERVSVGWLARNWAERTKRVDEFESLSPAMFHPAHTGSDATWANMESPMPDYLGNEFLLWLWHTLETDTDTIKLADKSEVTVMFAKSLSLECPNGESGKEVISAEMPTRLPEAMEAISTGKMPRKAGLILVRHGQQFELTLQSESFSVSGAKLQADEEAEGRAILESRIDAIRNLNETLDLLFESFCQLRCSSEWSKRIEKIGKWISPAKPGKQRPAA